MSLHLPRRRFLGALAGLIAAPAIVKAESLMRISAPRNWFGDIKWVQNPLYEGPIAGLQGGFKSIMLDGRSILEFDTALRNFWDNFNLTPEYVEVDEVMFEKIGVDWSPTLSGLPERPASPQRETSAPPASPRPAAAGWRRIPRQIG